MEIREGNNHVVIESLDRVPRSLPASGDVELSVEVSSEQFRGQAFTWIAAPALASFVTQLRALECQRQGQAILKGMSADEFRLRIWSVNRRGHVAIEGRINKQVYQGETGPYRHVIEFGFAFHPTRLPGVLAAFQAIAE